MTRPLCVLTFTAALLAFMFTSRTMAQQPRAARATGSQPYIVGNRLGLPTNPTPDGAFNPISPNVKVYGAIYSAESCSYDPVRGVIPTTRAPASS